MPLTTGKILLVDDEPALLSSMRAYLARQGYDVAAYPSSRPAWEQFSADPRAYALAIVDMKLNGASGEELINKILELNPAIAVVAISGYPDSLKDLQQEPVAHIRFLEKPFTPHMLKEAVEQSWPKVSGQSG